MLSLSSSSPPPPSSSSSSFSIIVILCHIVYCKSFVLSVGYALSKVPSSSSPSSSSLVVYCCCCCCCQTSPDTTFWWLFVPGRLCWQTSEGRLCWQTSKVLSKTKPAIQISNQCKVSPKPAWVVPTFHSDCPWGEQITEVTKAERCLSPSVWNLLPPHIRNAAAIATFKSALKTFLQHVSL